MASYAKVAVLNTSGAPFGFASLRHISYPTMVLGKSCKLVPVLFMNVRLPIPSSLSTDLDSDPLTGLTT